MAILAALLLPGGCSGTPAQTGPVSWWRSLTGAVGGTEAAEPREAPPGADQPFPNLATVPPRPTATDAATRQRITEGLVADRSNARYVDGPVPRLSADAIRMVQPTRPAPRAEPAAPPGGRMQASIEAAPSGPASSGTEPASRAAPRSAVTAAPLPPPEPGTQGGGQGPSPIDTPPTAEPMPERAPPPPRVPRLPAPAAEAPPQPVAPAAPAASPAAPAAPPPPPALAPAAPAPPGLPEQRSQAPAAPALSPAPPPAPALAMNPVPPRVAMIDAGQPGMRAVRRGVAVDASVAPPGAPPARMPERAAAPVAAAAQPAALPGGAAQTLTVAFAPGSSVLAAGEAAALRSAVGGRARRLRATIDAFGEVAPQGGGEAADGVRLAYARGEAVADALRAAGVPASAIEVRPAVGGQGRGAVVRLLD